MVAVVVRPLTGTRKRAKSRTFYRNVSLCVVISLGVVYVLVTVVLTIHSQSSENNNTRHTNKNQSLLRRVGWSQVALRHRVADFDEETSDGVRQARAYLQRFHSPSSLDHTSSTTTNTRQLKFLHVPKTAGTAIEDAAGAVKLPWGSCLFPHKPKRDICHYPKPPQQRHNNNNNHKQDSYNWPEHVGWWHLPLFFFPLCNIHPYQHAETFAVIREPYDRMVSEFYYICTLKVFDWRPDQCHNRTQLNQPNYMNQWLRDKLLQMGRATSMTETSDTAGTTTTAAAAAMMYLQDNGHFTPQYDFIVGPNQVRYVDHVLRLESLNDGFVELNKAYGLQLALKKMNALGAESREGQAQLTTHHLEKETLELVHSRFENDFALGGYPRKGQLQQQQQQQQKRMAVEIPHSKGKALVMGVEEDTKMLVDKPAE